MSPGASRGTGRTRALPFAELAALTRRHAEDVRAGRHAVHADPDRRWHVRLHCDETVDVWLISWTTSQGTELHDHGPSAGAFAVVGGTLQESVWAGGHLVEVTRSAGETVVFGAGYVHDVRNTAAPTAVSVHAYSPPLRQMGFYDVDGGRLVRRAESWTDDPEAPAPAREAS